MRRIANLTLCVPLSEAKSLGKAKVEMFRFAQQDTPPVSLSEAKSLNATLSEMFRFAQQDILA